MVFVLMVLSVFTVLATIVVLQAGYARRVAYDRLWAEQRRSASEALLQYTLSWCHENNALISHEHEKSADDEATRKSSWQLPFDTVPVSEHRTGQATIDVQIEGKLDILCSVKLHDGKTTFSRASCKLAMGDADKPASIREWAVQMGA